MLGNVITKLKKVKWGWITRSTPRRERLAEGAELGGDEGGGGCGFGGTATAGGGDGLVGDVAIQDLADIETGAPDGPEQLFLLGGEAGGVQLVLDEALLVEYVNELLLLAGGEGAWLNCAFGHLTGPFHS